MNPPPPYLTIHSDVLNYGVEGSPQETLRHCMVDACSRLTAAIGFGGVRVPHQIEVEVASDGAQVQVLLHLLRADVGEPRGDAWPAVDNPRALEGPAS